MTAERNELRQLVDELPEEQVLAEVRRHLVPMSNRPWPPVWLGAVTAGRTDTAARSDEILAEGFGRSK